MYKTISANLKSLRIVGKLSSFILESIIKYREIAHTEKNERSLIMDLKKRSISIFGNKIVRISWPFREQNPVLVTNAKV